MGFKGLTRFAVSMKPKVKTDALAGKHDGREDLHAKLNGMISGEGEILDAGGHGDSRDAYLLGADSGELTEYASNNAGAAPWAGGGDTTIDTNTELVFIKHSGLLLANKLPCADADTLLVKVGTNSQAAHNFCTLKSGEAIVIPRPSGNVSFSIASGSAAIIYYAVIIGT